MVREQPSTVIHFPVQFIVNVEEILLRTVKCIFLTIYYHKPIGARRNPSVFTAHIPGINKTLPHATVINWNGQYCTARSSRYSDWLRAGRSSGLGSSPGKVKNFLYNVYRGLFLRGWSGRIVKLTTATSAEVKKIWIYTFTPPYTFMV
jgi:hypothetical protein